MTVCRLCGREGTRGYEMWTNDYATCASSSACIKRLEKLLRQEVATLEVLNREMAAELRQLREEDG